MLRPTAALETRGRKRSEREALPQVGGNLRRLRTKKGYSLERLARACGVSRAMLGQIELGQSTPSITVLWRISAALAVPFGALLGSATDTPTSVLRAQGAARLLSADGSFSSRPLFPFGQGPRKTEFYELRLQPSGCENALPHPQGTTENLVVSSGRLIVHMGLGPGAERTLLGTGDAIVFRADVEHSYENPDDLEETVMYLVMSYASDL